MKKTFLFSALVALIFACSTKEKHHEEMKGWKELDSFHEIMADAYHPLRDSGNIAPAKKLAEQLAEEASHWAASSLPEQVNNEQMKAYLEKLKTDSRALADDIAKGVPDDVIKEKLTALHGQFHLIMKASQSGHPEEGEEHEESEDHDHHHDEDDED